MNILGPRRRRKVQIAVRIEPHDAQTGIDRAEVRNDRDAYRATAAKKNHPFRSPSRKIAPNSAEPFSIEPEISDIMDSRGLSAAVHIEASHHLSASIDLLESDRSCAESRGVLASKPEVCRQHLSRCRIELRHVRIIEWSCAAIQAIELHTQRAVEAARPTICRRNRSKYSFTGIFP